MRLFPFLVALLPSLAFAQGLSLTRPGATGGGKVLWSAAFGTPGCYASGQTAGASSAIAITRTTSATYVDGNGDVQTCAAGQFRVAPDGLLVEPARTNYVLQSTTHPKAAEATGTLPTGLYYARHTGGGTMTIAAGTATITGLSCTTVAVGTPCTFTVTVTGTAAITTTAGATRAQIELGAFGTSWIDTTTTALARNQDTVTATIPSVPSKWCVAATAMPVEQTAWGSLGAIRIWATGGTGANSSYIDTGGLTVIDAAAATRIAGYTFPASGSVRLIGCSTAGVLSLSATAGTVGALSGAGTGILGTPGTTLFFGNNVISNRSISGYLKDIRIYKVTKAKDAR